MSSWWQINLTYLWKVFIILSICSWKITMCSFALISNNRQNKTVTRTNIGQRASWRKGISNFLSLYFFSYFFFFLSSNMYLNMTSTCYILVIRNLPVRYLSGAIKLYFAPCIFKFSNFRHRAKPLIFSCLKDFWSPKQKPSALPAFLGKLKHTEEIILDLPEKK